MQVIVLGGGYAGLTLVRELEAVVSADVNLTLVDERESHLVQHLLHRTVRVPSLADRLLIPFEEVLSRTTHRQARVTGIDYDRRVVELTDGTLTYDICLVCLGGTTAFHGLSGVETHATPLKRPSHAQEIRTTFDSLLETGGRVIVGGAGLSGIQLAGELAELAVGADTPPEILLLEEAQTVAPTFSETFQMAIREELDARGVDVWTGQRVVRADTERVTLASGTELDYDQFVWTGGIRGQDALAGERPVVRATLRLDDRLFGLGDAVRVIDADGAAVPATAQAAIGQAAVGATNVDRLVRYLQDGSGFEPLLKQYRQQSPGWVVSVGDGTVAQVGPSVLQGLPARTLKTTLGARYIGSLGQVENALGYVRETFDGR